VTNIEKYTAFFIFVALNYEYMTYTGVIIGLSTFIIIGLLHPIVIKAEYYFGKRCWWVFALGGVIFGLLSLFVHSIIFSSISGVIAFSCFWSIHELFEQENRVKKGWFPANPKREQK